MCVEERAIDLAELSVCERRASDLAELSVCRQLASAMAELPVCGAGACQVPVIWQNYYACALCE